MTVRGKGHFLAKVVRYGWGSSVGALALRTWVDSLGRGAITIGRRPLIVNRGRIEIGSRFRTRTSTLRSSIETGEGAVLKIGDDVFINQGSVIYAALEITIGNRVDIGDAVRIYDTNFHPTRPGAETKISPVVIEDDVWIASGAVILPGVRIGRGSVVGAGAIVTRSVAPGSLVSGPAATEVSSFEVPDGFRRRDL